MTLREQACAGWGGKAPDQAKHLGQEGPAGQMEPPKAALTTRLGPGWTDRLSQEALQTQQRSHLAPGDQLFNTITPAVSSRQGRVWYSPRSLHLEQARPATWQRLASPIPPHHSAEAYKATKSAELWADRGLGRATRRD